MRLPAVVSPTNFLELAPVKLAGVQEVRQVCGGGLQSILTEHPIPHRLLRCPV